MSIILGKYPEFVFDARTIPGTTAVNHSGKQRRIFEALPQYVVNPGISVKYVTLHLLLPSLHGRRDRQKTETVRITIAVLHR